MKIALNGNPKLIINNFYIKKINPIDSSYYDVMLNDKIIWVKSNNSDGSIKQCYFSKGNHAYLNFLSLGDSIFCAQYTNSVFEKLNKNNIKLRNELIFLDTMFNIHDYLAIDLKEILLGEIGLNFNNNIILFGYLGEKRPYVSNVSDEIDVIQYETVDKTKEKIYSTVLLANFIRQILRAP